MTLSLEHNYIQLKFTTNKFPILLNCILINMIQVWKAQITALLIYNQISKTYSHPHAVR